MCKPKTIEYKPIDPERIKQIIDDFEISEE